MYASGLGGDNAVRELSGRVVRLLGEGRGAGLVTDIDGTISPIVAVPGDAFVLPGARAALAGLRERLQVVAVLTGRSVADAYAMVQLDGLTYVGNHGLELRTADGPRLAPEAADWAPRLAAVLQRLEQQVQTPGVVLESKGITASVHYRLAADPAATRQRLLELVRGTDFRIEEGRLVLNLLPPIDVNKGTAVGRLVREQRLERVVCLGDDLTDTHAFTVLRQLRAEGRQTLSIGVVGPETPAAVRELADAWLPTPQAVAELLAQVLAGLQTGARMEASDGVEQQQQAGE